MVLYFHFHTPNSHFDEQLETSRCTHSLNNQRCKNRVCIGLSMCWIHSRNFLHIKVQQSTIPNAGVGLFAFDATKPVNEIVFKRGDKICDYNGEIIDETEKNRRYGNKTGVYILQINNQGRYEDGATQRGIGTLLNSPSGSNRQDNCRFSIGRDKKAHIVALRNIRNNNELFINYGRLYRFNENNVVSSINQKKYNI